MFKLFLLDKAIRFPYPFFQVVVEYKDEFIYGFQHFNAIG